MLFDRRSDNDSGPDNHFLTLGKAIKIIGASWKRVGGFSLICAVFTAFITLLIPNRYTATSSILPGINMYQSGGLMSIADNLPGLEMMGLNLGAQQPSVLFPEVLQSRQLAEMVLNGNYSYKDGKRQVNSNLYEYFEENNPDQAYRILADHSDIEYDKKTGLVSVSVTTRNADLSAQVANYFIESLDNFNKTRRSTGAGLNRDFIAQRIRETETELKQAEEALRQFRDNNRNYYHSTDPELQMIHDRLLRDVEVKKQVYLTLNQQYEIAAIQAKKELPVIQVLDRARPPSIKSGPARTKMTVMGLIVGLMIASMLVLLEYSFYGQGQSGSLREAITRLRFVNRQKQTETSDYVR